MIAKVINVSGESLAKAFYQTDEAPQIRVITAFPKQIAAVPRKQGGHAAVEAWFKRNEKARKLPSRRWYGTAKERREANFIELANGEWIDKDLLTIDVMDLATDKTPAARSEAQDLMNHLQSKGYVEWQKGGLYNFTQKGLEAWNQKQKSTY